MPRKIMVVDDDPNAQRLVSYTFEAEGYIAATASTGGEALARLAAERPDLLVLDVMMPDMSGLEVCQRIRANRSTAHLPILMLSARGLVEDRISGLRAGADDYLPKPADTGELIARAEALLARASLSAPPRAQTYAFIGAKGGAGTTTLAINAGAQIAAQGHSVCLVDLRPGPGTAAPALKLRPSRDLGEFLVRPINQISESDVMGCVVGHACGLRVLAAPQMCDTPLDIRPELVAAVHKHLASSVEYILFDLPPSWSPANKAAIGLARLTLLALEPDPLSIECAKASLATLRQWGIIRDLVGLVTVNRGNISTPLTITALKSALGANIISAVPPAPEVGLASARDGVPLTLLQPRHLAATAIREMTERMLAERIRGI